MEFVIITGMSGAGKSSVVGAMEDIGFFCVDNLPVELIGAFAQISKNSQEHKKIAIVIDIRAGSSFSGFINSIKKLSEFQIDYKLMFIDATDETLVTRYQVTRRKHPLAITNNDLTSDLVAKERMLLTPARDIADFIIETTSLSVNDCKSRVRDLFCKNPEKQLHLHFMSFGFKHGLPIDADYVFDVRFLENPFYQPELKTLTGLDKQVRDFVMSFEQSKQLETHFKDLLDLVIPGCIDEARSQLVVAIGCTGGHHRSVTFVANLCDYFTQKGYCVSVSHRDILK